MHDPHAHFHDIIKRKNLIRIVVVVMALATYFGFSFGWGGLKVWFSGMLANMFLPVSVLTFAGLIVIFLLLEGVYLLLINRLPKISGSELVGLSESGDAQEKTSSGR